MSVCVILIFRPMRSKELLTPEILVLSSLSLSLRPIESLLIGQDGEADWAGLGWAGMSI